MGGLISGLRRPWQVNPTKGGAVLTFGVKRAKMLNQALVRQEEQDERQREERPEYGRPCYAVVVYLHDAFLGA